MSKIMIKDILRGQAFFSINKRAIKAFGLDEAAILCLLCDFEVTSKERSEDGWFPVMNSTIQNELNLGRKPYDSAIQNLIKNNIISTQVKGMPARRYVQLNYAAIQSSLFDSDNQECPNGTIQFVQNGQSRMSESCNQECPNRTTLNNISSNTTPDSRSIYEDNIKKDRVKENIIKPSQKKREKEKFDLSFVAPEFGAAFIEWLEYKHEIKDAYTTQRGVKAAYDSLVDLSNGNPEVAMAIVKQSEANNWKGLFKLKDYGKSVSTYSGTAAGATQYRNDSERLYAESAAFLQAIASQNN